MGNESQPLDRCDEGKMVRTLMVYKEGSWTSTSMRLVSGHAGETVTGFRVIVLAASVH